MGVKFKDVVKLYSNFIIGTDLIVYSDIPDRVIELVYFTRITR